jgi:pimeloyl-ACP methyl ester carboxylesterase
MQAAATSFRAYAVDLWGFGDTAHDPGCYGLERQIELLDRFMMEMGLGKVAFVGHGLGGLVAILFARRHPELVDRLMAVNVPLEPSAVAQRLRAPASPSDLAEWLLSRDTLTEPARSDAPKADLQAIAASFRELDTTNFMGIMDGMNTPCLLVHGLNDAAVQSPLYERIMAMPENVHQVMLEESGHFPMLDESTKFNHLMADFLGLFSGESPRQLQLKEEWKRRVR